MLFVLITATLLCNSVLSYTDDAMVDVREKSYGSDVFSQEIKLRTREFQITFLQRKLRTNKCTDFVKGVGDSLLFAKRGRMSYSALKAYNEIADSTYKFLLKAYLKCRMVPKGPPRSCTDYNNLGYKANRVYTIDPDGSQGQTKFFVTCDMSTYPPTTIVSHNREARTHVKGKEKPGSFVHAVRYTGRKRTVSIAQINGLTKIAASCSQYIKYECKGSMLKGHVHGWWLDRSGKRRNYWGDGNESTGGCKCYKTKSCKNNSKNKCNCDQNSNNFWTYDAGYLRNKAQLPVTQVQFGDTGHKGEEGYYTLGKLKCQVA